MPASTLRTSTTLRLPGKEPGSVGMDLRRTSVAAGVELLRFRICTEEGAGAPPRTGEPRVGDARPPLNAKDKLAGLLPDEGGAEAVAGLGMTTSCEDALVRVTGVVERTVESVAARFKMEFSDALAWLVVMPVVSAQGALGKGWPRLSAST